MSPSMPSKLLPFPLPDPLALLAQVRQLLTQKEIGKRLSVTPKTVGRWERKYIGSRAVAADSLCGQAKGS
jgi:transcriptional regulator with XRE-family HTH domain